MSLSHAVTLTPTVVHPSTDISLPDITSNYGSVTQGGLLSCGTVAWIVFEKSLIIVNAATGKSIQSWLPPPEAGTIVHVAELTLGNNSQSFMVVGLEQDECGVVVVLSPTTARVLRAFEVPDFITCVHPFSSSIYASFVNAYCLPDLFEDSVLRCFSGIVAVGCHGGAVYLVNLHLNLEDDLFGQRLFGNFSKLYLIEETIGDHDVQSVGESGQLACVQLTQGCYSRDKFIYQKRLFNPCSVKVTALQLVSQIRCLCVGYSFGGFHLYSFCPLMLVCSSPLPQHTPSTAVTHFAYLEPENDPRSFVYLWVATGTSPFVEESAGSETKISLYQMIFADKIPPGHQPGVVYRNLQSCCLRLEYVLTSTPSISNPLTFGVSSLLRCSTVCRYHQGRGLDESVGGPSHLLDQTLSMFVWVSGEEHFLGLFDINQWYQAQMPNTVHWKKSGKYTGVLGCSYFGFYSLNPLTEQSKQLLDVGLSSLLPFNSLSPVPETHTWPTSLSFKLIALNESSIHSCECYGLQKSVLYELDLCRGALCAQPEKFFNMCMQADLLLHHWEYDASLIDLSLQRKALLTVLVDWNCPNRVLNAFMESWLSDGGCAAVVTEWLSHKLTELTREKKALCKALFEGFSPALPLVSHQRQLAAIASLLDKILTYVSLADDEENSVFSLIDELYCKVVSQQRVLDVVIFLDSHGLAAGGDKVTGRYASISRHYDQLRGHGQNKQKLAVDYLCEEVDQPYPPHSLQEFVFVFETSKFLTQHCLMLYLLCDLQQSTGDGQLYLLNCYSSVQSLPPHCGVFVYTLWLLDNKQYLELEGYFLQIPKELTPFFKWQHGAMIDGLIRAGKNGLALKYIKGFGVQMQLIDKVKTKMSVLVWNQKLHDALHLMLQYEGSDSFEDLFNSFLVMNYEAKSLHRLVGLPFGEVEESLFICYLNQHHNLVVREILVFYYLSQHRFVEAVAAHEELKLLAKSDPDPKTVRRCLQREIVLKGFNAAIPKVLGKREAQCERLSETTKVVADAPGGSLSSVVAKAARGGQIGSQAGLIYCTLQSVAQKRLTQEVPLTPFRKPGRASVPFLSTPVSVKKARAQSYESITFASNHKLAPTPSVSHTPRLLDDTQLSFHAHMLNFRDRFASMLDRSPAAEGLDISNIHIPATVASNLLTKPLLSVVTPPSILKGSLSTKQSGTEGKKIRFAVESPVLTPFQGQRRLPSNYTPAAVSSLTVTAISSIAASTSLPMSDDSDQFESPAESPSQLEQYSLCDACKPPKFVLDEDNEVSDTQGERCVVQEEAAVNEAMNYLGDKEDSHRTVGQSFDAEEECHPAEDDAVSTTIPSLPVKGLMEKSTRESVHITPLKVQSADKTPEKPTSSLQVSTFCSVEPTQLYSPIPMLSELVESKKEKLMKSLTETKLRHSAVTVHQKEKQSYFSPTMVKYSTDTGVSSTSSALVEKQYHFSPPTERHPVDQTSTKSTSEFDMTTFVFSPPLTRSAARRMKGKCLDTLAASIDTTSMKKRSKGRPTKRSTTPMQDIKPAVALISPPSHPATPTVSTKDEVRRVKRAKPVKSGVQTRRSARLLTGKK